MSVAPSVLRARPVTYQLVIELSEPLRLAVGRLGTFDFPAGGYVYTGSAKSGIEARVRRHLRQDKRLHWHIDFLLAAREARVTATRNSTISECLLNQRTAGMIVASGFGASDCHSGCGSHLKWFGIGER